MKLKPLGAKALVKMIESDEQTVSGIVLPDTARQKPQTAEVVAVGDSDEVKVEGGAPDSGRRRRPPSSGRRANA
jgi:chaperonin GroES